MVLAQEVHHKPQAEAEDLSSYDRNYLEAGNLRQAQQGILDYVGLEVMDVIEEEDCIPAGVGMDYNSSYPTGEGAGK